MDQGVRLCGMNESKGIIVDDSVVGAVLLRRMTLVLMMPCDLKEGSIDTFRRHPSRGFNILIDTEYIKTYSTHII